MSIPILTSIIIFIIAPVVAIFAVYFWGDWRHWKRYYPTILFYIAMNLLAMVLMSDHLLWIWEDTPITPPRKISEFLFIYIFYPADILIFLAHYPRKWVARIVWILLFVVIMSILEISGIMGGYVFYDYGWGFWWSVGMNLVIHLVLLLHFKRPLWAWLISIPLIAFFLMQFGFSIGDLN